MKYWFLITLLFPTLLNAQEVPTREAIYNFDIGDEFHYFIADEGDCYIFTTSRKIILAKEWSMNDDTVFYEYRYERFWTQPTGNNLLDTFYQIDTFNVFYTNLSMPIENTMEIDTSMNVDFTYDSIQWCLNTIVRFGWCYNCEELGSSFMSKHYGIGLGKVFECAHDSEEIWTSTNLIYANKINSGECGERDDRILNLESTLISELNVYPNPASGLLTVSSSNQIYFDKILCFDHNGRFILELRLENNQLDISELPNGHFTLVFVKGRSFDSKRIAVYR